MNLSSILDFLTAQKTILWGKWVPLENILHYPFFLDCLVQQLLLKVGGSKQFLESPFGMRFALCSVADLCKVRCFLCSSHSQLPGWPRPVIHVWYEKIREAASKEEQCEIDLFSPMGKSLTKSEIEGTRSKYHKYCPKSKSSNIISCPKEIIKNHLKLKWFNDYFKIIAKKSEKTKKTKYNSKKKNKFKSKNHKCKKKWAEFQVFVSIFVILVFFWSVWLPDWHSKRHTNHNGTQIL